MDIDTLRVILLASLFATCTARLSAQGAFNSGSNGNYGPMNITSNTTLQLPPDGIFNCTTVTISPSARVSFAKNALNTPVYILATGDVIIGDGAGFTVSGGNAGAGDAGGVAGPGGFDGGNGSSSATSRAGAGFGPGGGSPGTFQLPDAIENYKSGGNASFRTIAGIWIPSGGQVSTSAPSADPGALYGNSLLIPLVGGSGGGGLQRPTGGRGGGGGGGAILIASSTLIQFGAQNNESAILATGGSGGAIGGPNLFGGGGSGGAVRLVAPRVTGSLQCQVQGYAPNTATGDGRFRVDAFDTTGLRFSSKVPDAIGTVMVVFPTPLPKLTVANAAGTPVAENATGPVSVLLPAGTPQTQTIQVRARDFGGVVPIRVRLVPESGDATTYDAQIDNTVTNPATTNVQVVLPINTGVRVEVFTR